MKRIFTFFLSLFVGIAVFAQTPQAINYQAVARNISGSVIANQNIGVRLSILNGSVGGPAVYTESHTVSTNAYGLFTLGIGQGVPSLGSFATVGWGSGTKFLKVEIDPAGGTNYQLQGTSQMLSVPYALYAENTTLQAGTGIAVSGNTVTNTGDLSTTNELQSLSLSGTVLTLSNNGGSVNLPSGGTNYTAGTGISIAGNVISNTAPDQGVFINPGTGIGVSGVYPVFSISNNGDLSATNEIQTLSLAGNVLSLSNNGGSVTLPSGGGSYTAGTGISITGSTINSVWTKTGNNIYNNNTDFVGIGVANPLAKLDVTTNALGTSTIVINAEYTGTQATDYVAVQGVSRPQDYYGFGALFEGGYMGLAGTVNPTGANDYYGVAGQVTNGSGLNFGVLGSATGTSSTNYGVYGQGDGVGTAGFVTNGNGYSFPEDPYGNLISAGVYGTVNSLFSADLETGVLGSATATGATFSVGLNGIGLNATNNNYGVYGYSNGNGANNYAIAVYGDIGTTGSFLGDYAGFFNGDLATSGGLSKAGGTFKIDHPQDPANKYLYHSFVESPDMMNIYNGNITTDANGFATVTMPAYFEAENIDFRYQLTCMGTFAQAIVWEEVKNNQFIIQTDKPNVKVSWQVTGVRNDKWAQAHRVVPEVNKVGAEKGRYLHPELYNQPTSAGIPDLMRTKSQNADTQTPKKVVRPANPTKLPKQTR